MSKLNHYYVTPLFLEFVQAVVYVCAQFLEREPNCVLAVSALLLKHSVLASWTLQWLRDVSLGPLIEALDVVNVLTGLPQIHRRVQHHTSTQHRKRHTPDTSSRAPFAGCAAA